MVMVTGTFFRLFHARMMRALVTLVSGPKVAPWSESRPCSAHQRAAFCCSILSAGISVYSAVLTGSGLPAVVHRTFASSCRVEGIKPSGSA